MQEDEVDSHTMHGCGEEGIVWQRKGGVDVDQGQSVEVLGSHMRLVPT